MQAAHQLRAGNGISRVWAAHDAHQTYHSLQYAEVCVARQGMRCQEGWQILALHDAWPVNARQLSRRQAGKDGREERHINF